MYAVVLVHFFYKYLHKNIHKHRRDREHLLVGMHTQIFTPPVAMCSAAVHPASARPPVSVKELEHPGGLAKGRAHLLAVLQEQGLDSVESDENAVVDVIYEFYLRHLPEYYADARTRDNFRASIQCSIAHHQRFSSAELTPTERDRIVQMNRVLTEQLCLEHTATHELELDAAREDHMRAWSDVTNRKFEATLRFCRGEDNQQTFEDLCGRLRRKHANCRACGRFAERRCGACKRAGIDCYYCSVECARLDRPVHKLVCAKAM